MLNLKERNSMCESKIREPIPCKKCICLAMCCNREEIYCTLLYDYLCYSDPYHRFSHYKGAHTAQAVYDLYNKYIVDTFYSKALVALGEVTGEGVPHEQWLTSYRRNPNRHLNDE